MKKILLLMLIASISIVSFGIIKYSEILAAAASNSTPQEVTAMKAQADSVLVAELNSIGIRVDRIGGAPLTTTEDSSEPVMTLVNHPAGPSMGTPENPSESAVDDANATAVTARYYHAFTILMADYDTKINGMFSAAKNEYLAIPESQRTADKKMQIGMKYVDIAQGYEIEADAQCEALLESFESDLESKNIDHRIVDEVRDYYSQYKTIQKQYYLAKLKSN